MRCLCADALPKRISSHVIHDLEPFFCVFDECRSPFACVNSYTGWLNHMRNKHTQPKWHCWYCKIAGSSSTSSTPEELESHLKEKHQNEVTDLLRPTLVKNSMIRPNHALRECPFCGEFPKDVEVDPSKRGHHSALVKLEKHVKDHLVSVALILAPMEREDPAGQFDNTQSEAQRGDQSQRDSNGVGVQYELECSNALCDCKTRPDLDFEQNLSPGHDAREDLPALWDIETLWKHIHDHKARSHDSDPLPLGLLHQNSSPEHSSSDDSSPENSSPEDSSPEDSLFDDSATEYSLPEYSSPEYSSPRYSSPGYSLPEYPLPVDLAEYINNSLRESEFPTPKNGYFAPKSTLSVVTNSSITSTMWPNSKLFGALADSDKKLVEFISEQAREIFAIGIYMDIHDQNLRNMMWLFMRHNKSDRNLPISDAEIEAMWPGPRNHGRRRSFQDSQHIFRPQSFPMRDRFSVVKLHPKVVLPIMKSECVSQGQYSIVYKVKLHEEFLDPHDPIRKVRLHQDHVSHFSKLSCVVCEHPNIFSNLSVTCWVRRIVLII